jgi:hypothetical protein
MDDELTPEELEKQDGEPLPERTQMSLISGPMPPTVIDLPEPGPTLPVEGPEQA